LLPVVVVVEPTAPVEAVPVDIGVAYRENYLVETPQLSHKLQLAHRLIL